ncbi:hypothetical protein Aduo_001451 [Ancylostoma duodenale]
METAEHIVSACSHWRTNIMVERHDDVARVLYSSLRRKYDVKGEVNTHKPHVIDLRVQEERKIGKYGINSTLPQDTAVGSFYPGPNLRSVLQKDRMCRVDVIPTVVGACGEVTPNLRRDINALESPDNTDVLIERIESAAVMGSNRLVKCHLSN